MKTVAALCVAALAGSSLPLHAAELPAAASRALLDQYCVTCHNERLRTAGLTLEKLDVGTPAGAAEIWEKVARKLRSGSMPPAGLPRPDKASHEGLTEFIETALDRAAAAALNPGRSSIHRLNRVEYTNAVRDLLALEIDGQSLLPGDSASYGFDNIADVLTISPGLMERYLSAARKISRLAVGDAAVRPSLETYKVSPLALQNERMAEDLPFGSRGGLAIRHQFPADGQYVITIRLLGNLRDADNVDVRMDGERVRLVPAGETGGGGAYQRVNTVSKVGRELSAIRVPVKAGTRSVAVAVQYGGPLVAGEEARLNSADLPVISRGFSQTGIHSVDISGPFDVTGPGESPSRQRILVCSPTSPSASSGQVPPASRGQARTPAEETCARTILSTLARRAYRRPVKEEDIRTLLEFYQAGHRDGGFETGVQRALERILIAPDFLFRIERDPAQALPGSAYRISDVELASRMSFFLWSSIPDDELLDLAARGRLRVPAIFERQVRRMLGDPRSSALVTNFASQWLIVRNLRNAAPDAQMFPDFSDTLREAFRRETELFIQSQIREDSGLPALLTANYTYLNEPLARFYGIDRVYGNHFRRVTFRDNTRGGLLGQGSILTVTSYPTRTSPTLRGKWVLENILGSPPPPPPPNVEGLKEKGANGETLSMRARMEQHRKNAICATCHSQMDPLGFALENYDAIGRWRTVDESEAAIDASGVLPDGRKFTGPLELRAVLFDRRREFVSTVVEKLLTYALGRGLTPDDMPAVRKIGRDAAACDYRWSCVIQGIVRSVPFEMRRAS